MIQKYNTGKPLKVFKCKLFVRSLWKLVFLRLDGEKCTVHLHAQIILGRVRFMRRQLKYTPWLVYKFSARASPYPSFIAFMARSCRAGEGRGCFKFHQCRKNTKHPPPPPYLNNTPLRRPG